MCHFLANLEICLIRRSSFAFTSGGDLPKINNSELPRSIEKVAWKSWKGHKLTHRLYTNTSTYYTCDIDRSPWWCHRPSPTELVPDQAFSPTKMAPNRGFFRDSGPFPCDSCAIAPKEDTESLLKAFTRSNPDAVSSGWIDKQAMPHEPGCSVRDPMEALRCEFDICSSYASPEFG